MTHAWVNAFTRNVRMLVGTNALATQLTRVEAELQGLKDQLGAMQTRPSPDVAKETSPAGPPEHRYVTASLPDGTPFLLNVGQEGSDDYHSAVSAGSIFDPTWNFTLCWVRPGDVVLDLGANIGTVAVPLAVKGASVHAFELLCDNVEHLARAVSRNDLQNLRIVHGAVGDKADVVGVAGHSAWGAVLNQSVISVPGLVIDHYVRQRGLETVDFMKIDVEGSEKKALAGATELLRNGRPDIVIECNAHTCGNNGYSYRELLELLESNSYSLYRIYSNRLCPWNSSLTQEIICADYFVSKKNSDEIRKRSGHGIAPLTEDECIESILRQDMISDIHKQYVLAIQDRLPSAVRANSRVRDVLERWRHLADLPPFRICQIGSE